MFSGDWQKHVRGQIAKLISIMFSPESFDADIRFVRHSPGRRRNDVTMYDVCMGSVAQSEAIRSKFAQYLRRDAPVQRPPELANISIHPLVCIFILSVSQVLVD